MAAINVSGLRTLFISGVYCDFAAAPVSGEQSWFQLLNTGENKTVPTTV